MLKKYSQVFLTLLLLSDILIIAVSWIGAYCLRAGGYVIPVYKSAPILSVYLPLTIHAVIIWMFVLKILGLYAPMRIVSPFEEAAKIIKASLLSLLIFITVVYFLKEYKYSRMIFFYFWVLSTGGLIISRTSLRAFLRYLRKKGRNLRFVLIVGAGALGQKIFTSIKNHPELGLRVVGFLTRRKEKLTTKVFGVPILGFYEDIKEILTVHNIDQIVFALPSEEHSRLKTIMEAVDNEMVDIKIAPDFFDYISLRGGVETLDNIPVITLRDFPLYGWNRILKRCFDILSSIIMLAVFSPLLVILAILIKATSPGPILYCQERMGLDGKLFIMFKFRTMRENAEQATGPVWAKQEDKRRTTLGAFLRKTSLDELPQLINVLKGEMSIVGPRPERPFFIRQFKEKVPRYMLRHKMKAGITGWAQVNGWRGNTSIEKRIEYDLFYIENWSLGFDIKIIWLTLWKGFRNKHAY